MTVAPTVDHGIRVKVEGSVSQLLQQLVQFETRPAGCKGSHEDVGLAVVQLVLFDVGVDDLQFVAVTDTYGVYLL